ncbi:MAG: RagB/SusD family nutrient uptake outer membrane protein, partial [Mariniphaga sp.]
RWRALDQMIATPYHVEGFKIWGPMQHWYDNPDGSSQLVFGPDNPQSLVSPPERSVYLRPFERVSDHLAFNGYSWHMAHYLYPIAIKHILITSQVADLSTSPIYQNPGWPLESGTGVQ